MSSPEAAEGSTASSSAPTDETRNQEQKQSEDRSEALLDQGQQVAQIDPAASGILKDDGSPLSDESNLSEERTDEGGGVGQGGKDEKLEEERKAGEDQLKVDAADEEGQRKGSENDDQASDPDFPQVGANKTEDNKKAEEHAKRKDLVDDESHTEAGTVIEPQKTQDEERAGSSSLTTSSAIKENVEDQENDAEANLSADFTVEKPEKKDSKPDPSKEKADPSLQDTVDSSNSSEPAQAEPSLKNSNRISEEEEKEEENGKQDPKSDPSSSSTSTEGSNSTSDASKTTNATTTSNDTSKDASESKPLDKVSIVLKLNRELIRFCMKLQSEGKGGQEIFNDVTSRLQSGCSYLASLADQYNPNSKRKPGSSLPRLDAFPSGSLPEGSPLNELYTSLIDVFKTEAVLQNESKAPLTTSDGKKREREDSQVEEESRKKQSSDESHRVFPNDSAYSNPTPSLNASTHLNGSGGSSNPSANPSLPNTSMSSNNALASTSTPPNLGTPVLNNYAAGPPPQQQQQQSENSLNAQHIQNFVAQYGPNAMHLVQMLQSHLKGFAHPFVTSLEAKIPGFRSAPIQAQLQMMMERIRAQREADARKSASQSHSQSPIPQHPSPIGMSGIHNRSGSSGGSPAPLGSPVTRLPVQVGGINPSDLMGNLHGGGPGSSSGSPAFSHATMSRPGTAGPSNHQDGSRPSTPAMVGTPGSSGSYTPGGSHMTNAGMVNGVSRNHGRQGSINDHQSPMLMNGFPTQQTSDPHQSFQQHPQQQQQHPYQSFNPQAMMGMNLPNQNGMGNQNMYTQQQQRQFVNNLQSLPPHLQQQMAQQMSSMTANGNFQGMNGMNLAGNGGIDMNAMMGSYQSQPRHPQQQNPNQWNSGR